MKPYGIRSKFLYNYKDRHPRRKFGIVNWWETELGDVKSKKTARQKIKQELKKIFHLP